VEVSEPAIRQDAEDDDPEAGEAERDQQEPGDRGGGQEGDGGYS